MNYNQRFIYFISLVAAMGGLLFGYDWVVIGGAKPFYELFFGIENLPSRQGLAMSIALVGCMLGAVTQGWLADRLGRKPLLIISAMIFLVSAVLTGAVNDFGWFLFARFLGGIGIGVASGLSPMYIAEVSPSHMRGRLVSLNQMTIVLGILGAQIVNMLIASGVSSINVAELFESWYGQMAWRWMFWAEAIPAAIFFIMAFFIPESPVWHEMKRAGGKKNDNAARKSISSLPPALLALGVFIAVFQQWCGTNVIFNYAQEIFQAAGYDIGDVLFNIVVTGVANVVFTVVAIFTVDRLGRRTLMLFGAGGLCLIYAIMGYCYYQHITGMLMIVLTVAAISCYAMTLGPCTWVLISELFPARFRSMAVGICTFALWIGSTTLTYTFPLLNTSLGSYGTFWIYTAVCLVGFLFFFCFLPETKGRKLE